jgi:hypothetical protein
MSNFWKFMGGLVVGAVAMKVANDYYKDTNEQKQKVDKPKVENQPNVSKSKTNSIQEVENLIYEFESKKNKTQKDKDVLDLLRVKLNQLKKDL